MDFILSFTFCLSCALLFPPSWAGQIFNEFIYPNFTASNFQFIDNRGAFLSSPNSTFQASISNPSESSNFYLCIRHRASNTVVWSANRDSPISDSDSMRLTQSGISIHGTNGNLVWSTPPLKSPVSALRLLETGNLQLLDQSNTTLWQSFDHPTDGILIGQRLPIGQALASSTSDLDPSTGDHVFLVTEEDAVLQWHRQNYWKLSMDLTAFKNSNAQVSFLQMNHSGLYLFNSNRNIAVWQVIFQSSSSSNSQDLLLAQLDYKGRLNVFLLTNNTNKVAEFPALDDDCSLPDPCGRLGLCTDSGCSCLANFRSSSAANGGCIPVGNYNFPASSCNANSSLESAYSYLELSSNVHYFANQFASPAISGSNLSGCKSACSKNCSCLGFFYRSSSASCYLLQNQLGSVFTSSDSRDDDGVGYIKMVVRSTPDADSNDTGSSSTRTLPLSALILLPCSGAFLLITLITMGSLWWRRSQMSKGIKLGCTNSTSSVDEFDPISIPGLPVRFKYEELEAATDSFKTQIGSGGFGAVYKGTLPDKTVVAVKKINNIGVQGKKEFCTEIAVIGNVHHVNLVRLKGFCAQGTQRLLVYEYMNRGSLDRSLFGVGPVLEWQERVDIALGTARGLAYLHGGCEHKIIHCDIKPENILLHDHSQVKISDFGLSKLMSPEQSNLFTTMRGTRGYLAPEWLTNSAISDRTDVYSYGMVLLEIIRGRKNCSTQGQTQSLEEENSDRSSSSASGTSYFPLFALEMHEQGRYLELADPRLEGRVRSEEVEKLVLIALCCVHEEPILRPSMATVMAMLEGGIPLGEPRLESLNFLRFYGRRFTEPATLEGLGDNAFLYRVATNSSTTPSDTHTSMSYLSSQQVSGPR